MFDPTGGHSSPVAIFIILLMCAASVFLIAICVLGVKNGRKYKKNIFLLCIFIVWMILAIGIGIYAGSGIFGLFLDIFLYSPIHILLWLIISGISFLWYSGLKGAGSGARSWRSKSNHRSTDRYPSKQYGFG